MAACRSYRKEDAVNIEYSLELSESQRRYIELLSEKYPTVQDVCSEIINLNAILNLPKGTEHFMSDLHGEYEAFIHILNNCSGVIKEKVDLYLTERLSDAEREDLCTLIYYPKKKLRRMKKQRRANEAWYRNTLQCLTELAKRLSSKYTRSKVRRAMPQEFAYVIDELLHAQPDEDDNQVRYHEEILDSIMELQVADEFIISLSELIKQLAVDHLHIVGDIFDRGPDAAKIMDRLLTYHSLDIQWGNHDVVWMGACAGSDACIANVLRINIRYHNETMLENEYGIPLRPLTLFAEKYYHDEDPMKAAMRAISVIMFKLEGQCILRHPEYDMDDHLFLDKMDLTRGTVLFGGKEYLLKTTEFPTVDPENPYALSTEEQEIMDGLHDAFINSYRLRKHVDFLYSKGAMYCKYNENLLYHGCIPLDNNGNFDGVRINGRIYKGRALMDYAEKMARRAYYERDNQTAKDFMWYLWKGKKSPLFGRNGQTFARDYITDESTWVEADDPYYRFDHEEKTVDMILREFGLYSPLSHIINGHTPVKVKKGEKPIKAGGKLLVIDGGFCRAYQKTTGIAGYTLIYNSHGMNLKTHEPFETVEKVLEENMDIHSHSEQFETEPYRVLIKDTDNGRQLAEKIEDLKLLLSCYRQGIVTEKR